MQDKAVGRFLVPDRREILASLRLDAEGALAYLTSLPERERGYRTFCAWSLMLGASALSQQLGVLRSSGLVRARREASVVHYSLTTPRVADLLAVGRQIRADLLALQVEILSDLRAEDEQQGR